MERAGATTLKGNPLTLLGPELKAGDAAPDFSLVDVGLKTVTLKDTGNHVRSDRVDGGRRRRVKAAAPAGSAAAALRSGLNSTESSAAVNAERVISRAVDSPLLRGGLTIVAGVLTGNVLGVGRVALVAYLLGTHSYADSLAVAMGPLDMFNSVLINSIIFAFVPLLTAAQGAERTALF